MLSICVQYFLSVGLYYICGVHNVIEYIIMYMQICQKRVTECMHSWLYELNITNYYILLLDLFVCLYIYILLACRLGIVSYSGGGGGGGTLGFPPPESLIVSTHYDNKALYAWGYYS